MSKLPITNEQIEKAAQYSCDEQNKMLQKYDKKIGEYWNDYEVQNPDGSWTTIAALLNSEKLALLEEILIETQFPKDESDPEYKLIANAHGFEAKYVPCRLDEVAGYSKAMSHLNAKIAQIKARLESGEKLKEEINDTNKTK